jgi:hypothetical protein
MERKKEKGKEDEDDRGFIRTISAAALWRGTS